MSEVRGIVLELTGPFLPHPDAKTVGRRLREHNERSQTRYWEDEEYRERKKRADLARYYEKYHPLEPCFYCSRRHRRGWICKRRPGWLRCLICGEEFFSYSPPGLRDRVKYCSAKKCQRTARAANARRRAHIRRAYGGS